MKLAGAWSQSKVRDNPVTEDGEFTVWKWFDHAVSPLLLDVNPNDFESSITPETVVPKKVVSDVDVSDELWRRVVVDKVNRRLVVHMNGDGTSNELSWNDLDDVDDPQ